MFRFSESASAELNSIFDENLAAQIQPHLERVVDSHLRFVGIYHPRKPAKHERAQESAIRREVRDIVKLLDE
jgi:hypothetical protein